MGERKNAVVRLAERKNMKLIITDTYPENGEKTFVIDSIYMDRLISFLDSGVPLPDRAAELLRAPVRAEQNGATEIVCTFDNDGGGVDIDVLKKMLKGKHGWLTAKNYANGQMQLFMTPHSNRSAGG